MRIVFLGNHTVGVRTLAALMECADVAHVVAHPPDPEDGAVYESVHDFARRCGLDTSRLAGSDAALIPLIERTQPDLLWITDYRYLLPGEVLALARLGTINLHPSLLPRYRGRASLNWAIIHGERTLGLTAHFVDEGMDSGDVIEQLSFELAEHEDVSDALSYLYPMYGRITSSVLSALRRGGVSRTPQDHARASIFPRRRPQDGRIDFRAPARRVRDLIRAVTKPYPGAFSYLGGAKVTCWKSVIELRGGDGRPGEIVEVDAAGSFSVMCGDAALRIVKHSIDPVDGRESALRVGQCFESPGATGTGYPGPVGSDVARIADYFGDRLARFGPVLSACDYGSLASQRLRFQVIREVLPFEGLRVLDVGCGLAHLADDFDAAQIAVDYEGVDICPAMIEQAKRRRPELRLSVLDVLREDVLHGVTDRAEPCAERHLGHRAGHRVGAGAYDVVVANGIFYLLQTDPVATMQRIITRLFELADRCVVFTSLSTWAPHVQPGEFQADPLATLGFCRTLTPRVVLRHDYLPHDFAVYLYREVEHV